MNAQEAIKRMERKLTADKNRLDSYKSNGRYDGYSYKKFEEDIEAYYIVLESAKMLHEHIVPNMLSDYDELGFTPAKSLYGVPFEKVGIEEGE